MALDYQVSQKIINIRNTGAVTLDALAVINFAVIKAVAA